MSVVEFILPPRLRRINGQKTNQPIRMCGHVTGYVLIVDPNAAEACFAAEYDCAYVSGGRGAVAIVRHAEIDFDSRASPPRLRPKIVGKMFRVGPGVAMNVDDHAVSESVPLSLTHGFERVAYDF